MFTYISKGVQFNDKENHREKEGYILLRGKEIFSYYTIFNLLVIPYTTNKLFRNIILTINFFLKEYAYKVINTSLELVMRNL